MTVKRPRKEERIANVDEMAKDGQRVVHFQFKGSWTR